MPLRRLRRRSLIRHLAGRRPRIMADARRQRDIDLQLRVS